ncbi:hypothetical protein NITHO_5160014 [Nitrolancea hollandica Lb]|uniref:Uncharacterized protein n=1 Tax=Nitrolancea hollandica Lb TaxID=1129897 RepID=I4ELK8_9BACT|nr:hypothetical protein NITHO_5160014 [Nitrolancea hollandica Lb]
MQLNATDFRRHDPCLIGRIQQIHYLKGCHFPAGLGALRTAHAGYSNRYRGIHHVRRLRAF